MRFSNYLQVLVSGFLLLFGLLLGGLIGLETISAVAPESNRFAPAAITLREVPETPYKELADEVLTFRDSLGITWSAPRGTLTDGASVPRLGLLVTDGRFGPAMLKAAVLHDAYCGEANVDRCPAQFHRRPWTEVHRMFYEALVAGGTPSVRAGIMFAAVWLGGPRWDDPGRDLSAIPDERIAAEFAVCRQWILDDKPGRQAIEDWMTKREPLLFAPPAAR